MPNNLFPLIWRQTLRLLRDRRILLGSLIALWLTMLGEVALYDRILHLQDPSPKVLNALSYAPLVIGVLFTGFWGCILAASLLHDETRCKRMDLLNCVPLSRLQLASLFTTPPVFICLVLFIAALPLMNEPYRLASLRFGVLHIPLSFELFKIAGIPLLMVLLTTHTARQEHWITAIFLAGAFYFMFYSNVLSRWIYPLLELNIEFVILIAISLLLLMVMKKKASYDFEGIRISERKNHLRLIRSHLKEEIPLYRRLIPKTRDSILTVAILAAAFYPLTRALRLSYFTAMQESFYVYLSLGFFLMLIAVSITAIQCIRREKRAGLLDEMRLTLLSARQIVYSHEQLSLRYPLVILFCILFPLLFTFLSGAQDVPSFFTMVFAGLMMLAGAFFLLHLAAQMGIAIALHAKDGIECSLWCFLLLSLWHIGPILSLIITAGAEGNGILQFFRYLTLQGYLDGVWQIPHLTNAYSLHTAMLALAVNVSIYLMLRKHNQKQIQ